MNIHVAADFTIGVCMHVQRMPSGGSIAWAAGRSTAHRPVGALVWLRPADRRPQRLARARVQALERRAPLRIDYATLFVLLCYDENADDLTAPNLLTLITKKYVTQQSITIQRTDLSKSIYLEQL